MYSIDTNVDVLSEIFIYTIYLSLGSSHAICICVIFYGSWTPVQCVYLFCVFAGVGGKERKAVC